MIERFVRGMKYAARSLAHTPRFTVIAVLTIALGIGVDTAVFSVVDGVLLKDLAYPRSQELVNLWSTAPGLGYERFPLSPDVYYFYRSQSSAFGNMALYSAEDMSVTGNGEPERVHTVWATASLFSTLAVAPLLGRAYTPAEDIPDGPHVVVISYGLWQRRFGGDPKVLGRTLEIEGVSREVVGVMPQRFDFPDRVDVWLPLGLDPKNPPTGSFSFPAIARLARGVTPAGAQAQLVPLVKRLIETRGDDGQYKAFLENGHYAPLVHAMKEDLVGDLERPLWVLLGTVAFVLLIACANAANLVLIRAEVRRREFAVRTALGASRGVLVRQNAAESALLAVMGGAVGLAVAWLGVPALLHHAPPQLPRLDGVGMNGTVVLFTLGVTALSALLFGVAPALRHSPALLAALKQGSRGATGGAQRQRARNLLVAVQTALALVLLVGSGLLVRSFWSARTTDLGFDPANLLTFRLSVPQAKYPTPDEVTAFHEELLARLRALPGVESAALTSTMPLEQGTPGTTFEVEGHPTEPGQLPPMLHYRRVSPGFAKTMGIHLLAGRAFVPSDLTDGAGHVVVDRTIAERFWPGQDAVGRQLRPLNDTTHWYTVEGVVAPVLDAGLRQEPKPLVYYPMAGPEGNQGWAVRAPTYVLRVRNPAALAASVRSAVWSVDPDMPLADVRTGDDLAAASVIQLSFTMFTLGIAALLALVLGAVGLYGVLSYSVAQRTQEIGVRMALGAERGAVMRMVVRDGAKITAVGLLAGLAGAAALTRLLKGILYDVKALDPLTFAGTALLLLAVAVMSSYLPARRAAAVDPMESIRVE